MEAEHEKFVLKQITDFKISDYEYNDNLDHNTMSLYIYKHRQSLKKINMRILHPAPLT